MWQSLHQDQYETVADWMDYYRLHSGKNYVVQKKYEYTENPSIQGMWHPFVHADPQIATAKFPVQDLAIPFGMKKSASEYLLDFYEKQKVIPPAEENKAKEDQLESTKQSE